MTSCHSWTPVLKNCNTNKRVTGAVRGVFFQRLQNHWNRMQRESETACKMSYIELYQRCRCLCKRLKTTKDKRLSSVCPVIFIHTPSTIFLWFGGFLNNISLLVSLSFLLLNTCSPTLNLLKLLAFQSDKEFQIITACFRGNNYFLLFSFSSFWYCHLTPLLYCTGSDNEQIFFSLLCKSLNFVDLYPISLDCFFFKNPS